MTEHIRSPQLVAEQILWLRRNATVGSTPMHLLKLVYLSHGWMLGLYDESLIYESVEAWTYGPVVPSVYHRYKSFGGGDVSVDPVDRTGEFTDEQQELIKDVVDVYVSHTALALSNITHQPGTPWDIAKRKYGIGTIIPNELIRNHYRQLADPEQKESAS